jgi:hypothetical protein
MSESEAHKSMTAAKMYALTLAIKDGMPLEINRADILAQIRRVHYDASIRKGFTASEALILCMSVNFT